jgi:hypothetical protein
MIMAATRCIDDAHALVEGYCWRASMAQDSSDGGLVIDDFHIVMVFLMFFFSSWVHGVSYRFHALKISLLPFIIESWMWMDNQGYFKASLRRRLLMRLN